MTEEDVQHAIDTVFAQPSRAPRVTAIETPDGRLSSGDYNAWLASLAQRGRMVDPHDPLGWLPLSPERMLDGAAASRYTSPHVAVR